MQVVGAMCLPREKMLEFKADAFGKMVRGVLKASKLDEPHLSAMQAKKVKLALDAFLKFQGLLPNDNSIMAWLQENPGEYIALLILRLEDKRLDFRLMAGDEHQLTSIGRPEDGTPSNNAEGATSVGEVNMGERARVVRPGQV